jgi:hypothetical protein
MRRHAPATPTRDPPGSRHRPAAATARHPPEAIGDQVGERPAGFVARRLSNLIIRRVGPSPGQLGDQVGEPAAGFVAR